MKITLELTDEQEFALKKIHKALNGREPIEKIASNMMSCGIAEFLTKLIEKEIEDSKKGNVA